MHIHIFTGAHGIAHAEEVEAGLTSSVVNKHATLGLAITLVILSAVALTYSVWKTYFPNAFLHLEKVAYSAVSPNGEVKTARNGQKVVAIGKFNFAIPESVANKFSNGQPVNVEVAYKATKLGNEQHIDKSSVWAVKPAR